LNLEYALYVLIVACAVLVCGLAIYAARPLARNRRSRVLKLGTRGVTKRAGARAIRASDHRARDVISPAPWGWPAATGAMRTGHRKTGEVSTPSSPLQRWTDQLVVEKKTTEDARYRAHREECIKALLEDRFCSQRRASPDDERAPPAGNGNGHLPLGDVRTPWGW
jgi:hypothetical protein